MKEKEYEMIFGESMNTHKVNRIIKALERKTKRQHSPKPARRMLHSRIENGKVILSGHCICGRMMYFALEGHRTRCRCSCGRVASAVVRPEEQWTFYNWAELWAELQYEGLEEVAYTDSKGTKMMAVYTPEPFIVED